MAGFLAAFANPFNYIGGVSFNPEKDISDLSGKVALVTGGMLKTTQKLPESHSVKQSMACINFLTSFRKCWSRQRNNSPTFKA